MSTSITRLLQRKCLVDALLPPIVTLDRTSLVPLRNTPPLSVDPRIYAGFTLGVSSSLKNASSGFDSRPASSSAPSVVSCKMPDIRSDPSPALPLTESCLQKWPRLPFRVSAILCATVTHSGRGRCRRSRYLGNGPRGRQINRMAARAIPTTSREGCHPDARGRNDLDSAGDGVEGRPRVGAMPGQPVHRAAPCGLRVGRPKGRCCDRRGVLGRDADRSRCPRAQAAG